MTIKEFEKKVYDEIMTKKERTKKEKMMDCLGGCLEILIVTIIILVVAGLAFSPIFFADIIGHWWISLFTIITLPLVLGVFEYITDR